MCCCSDYRRALIPKASLVLSPYQLTAMHTSLRLGGEKSMSIDGFGTAVPLPKAFFPKKKKKERERGCGNIHCRCHYDKGFRLSNVVWYL